MSVRKRFGTRLRALRKARGLSQPQLADLIGARKTQDIGSYEAGKVLPHAVRIDAIVEALGIDVSELFTTPEEATAPDLAEAIRILRDASKRDPLLPSMCLRLLRSLIDK